MRIVDVDYISLTDLAKYSNPDNPTNVIIHWMSNKGTYDYIGLWEELNNENFKVVEFDHFKNEAGRHAFTMSPQKWIRETNLLVLFLNRVNMVV